MKKLSILLLLIFLTVLFPMVQARADFGPKRSLDVEIIGAKKPYHIELLMEGDLPNQAEIDEMRPYIESEYPDYPEMLYTFEDEGYVSANLVLPWGVWQQNPEENYFIYSYNPPEQLKIMLVFNDGNYLTSKVIETSLFNSKITYDVTAVDQDMSQLSVGKIREVLPVQTMSIELATRIIGTIFIEIVVLFVFGYMTKKSYLLVTYVNLFTQVILTGFMFAAKYYVFPIFGELFVLIIGEIMIFLTELIIFRFYLTEKSRKRAMLYALVANFFSLVASYTIMIVLMNF